MKILAVATRVPQLDSKGDQLVAYHRLMALVRSGHQVELICCLTSPLSASDDAAVGYLQSVGINCETVFISQVAQIYNLVSVLFKPNVPLQSGLFRSQNCQKLILRKVQDFNPDLLYLVLYRSYVNAVGINIPLVVDFIDSVSMNYNRAARKKSFLLRYIFNLEAMRSRHYERELAKLATLSFVVAMDDAQYIDSGRVHVLHLGVDTMKFSAKCRPTKNPRIIFSGNMNYRPNVEAVSWFCENCWPEIIRIHPEARFIVCGANPAKEVSSLSSRYPNITVTGRVESVATELGQSWISIAPMHSGAGMQFKILEAMSCSLPLVTTSVGRGSIAAEMGSELLVADNAADFTEHVMKLLDNPVLRESIGSRARLYVSRNHDWNEIGRLFVSYLVNLSSKKA